MKVFVGRTEEQDRFRRLLVEVWGDGQEQGPDEAYVMLVRGPGGIGKSSLLRRYYDIATGKLSGDAANRQRFLVAMVDWETDQRLDGDHYRTFSGPPIWHILEQVRKAIAASLADSPRDSRRAKRAFANFCERVLRAPELEERARRLGISPASAHRGQATDQIASVLDVTASGAARAAGIPVPSGQPIQNITKAVSSIRRHRRGQVDATAYEVLVDATGAMVRAFADGLRTLSRWRPVVLILDTCEMLGGSGDWLRETMRRSGQAVLWVVGMRLESESDAVADSESASYQRDLDERRLRTVAVARFDDRSIARYLHERGDLRLKGSDIARVAKDTRGVPLNVSTVCELLSRGVPLDDALAPITSDGEVSRIVRDHAQRYLIHTRNVDELRDDLPRLFGLALLRGRDPDLLATLWNVELENVGPGMDILARRHDFVRSASRSLHQEFRETIQLYLLDPDNRAGIRKMNDRAARYLRARLAATQHTTVDTQLSDETWRSTVDALLWHTCWIEPAEGVALLSHLFPAAAVLAPDWASILLDTARFFTPVCLPTDQRTFTALDTIIGSQHRGDLGPNIAAVFNTLPTELPEAPVVAAEPSPRVHLNLLRAQHGTRLGLTNAQQVTMLRQAAADVPASETTTARALGLAVLRLADATNEFGPAPVNFRNALLSLIRYAIRCDRTNSDSWFTFGRTLTGFGKYADAERAYDQVIKLNPRNAEAHYNLGDVLSRQYRYAEAEGAFQQAIQFGLNDADAHIRLGDMLVSLNRHIDAMRTYRNAINLTRTVPDIASAYIGLGNALYGMGRFSDSEHAYREAIRLDPENATAYGNLGDALSSLNRPTDAIRSYRHSIHLNPNSLSHHNLGLALQNVARYVEAEQAYRKAMRLDPENTAAHCNLGNVLTDLGRFAEAAQAYQEGLRFNADNDSIRANYFTSLGWLYLKTDDLASSRASLLQAVQIADHTAMADFLLWVLSRADDSPAVHEHLLEARNRLNVSRSVTTTRYQVVSTPFWQAELCALVFTGLGDPDEAVAVLTAAIPSRLPDNQFCRPLYDLLARPEPPLGLDRLLNVWREIISADSAAAGPWGGPDEPRANATPPITSI